MNKKQFLTMMSGGASEKIYISDNFSSELAAWWTNTIGSFETNGGIARAASLVEAGKNICQNPEFTTDLTGWVKNPAYGGDVTRKDFTSSPNIAPTGGLDDYGVEVLHSVADYTNVEYAYDSIVGATYKGTCRAYNPSTNTWKTSRFSLNNGVTISKLTAADVWQTLTNEIIATSSAHTIRLLLTENVLNDVAYFDKIMAQLKMSIATFDVSDADIEILIKVTTPSSGVVPFGIVARYLDDTHYWLWKITPGTAGTDFALVQVNGTSETVVDTYDHDWSTSTQYALKLEHYGTKYRASVDGVEMLSYTDAGDFNTTETKFGLYDLAIANAQFDDLEVRPVSPFDDLSIRIYTVGDSRAAGHEDNTPPPFGENGWPYILEQSIISQTGHGCFEQRCAFSGYTNAQLKAVIDAQLALNFIDVDFVLIASGFNDIAAPPPQATFESDYGYILDAVHAKWPNATVLCSQIHYGDASINPWIANVVSARSDWASISFDESDFQDGWPSHPDHSQHVIWAGYWKTALGY